MANNVRTKIINYFIFRRRLQVQTLHIAGARDQDDKSGRQRGLFGHSLRRILGKGHRGHCCVAHVRVRNFEPE